MALQNQPTTTGFHEAPVCKSLAVLVGGLHLASNVPALHPFFRRLVQVPESIDGIENALRYVGTKFVFLDTKSAVLACVIIYFFRVFERRSGSLKFSSNLLLSWMISVSLEIACEQYFGTLNFGPLSLIIPLYIPWFLQIPQTKPSNFGPLAVSSKSFNYLLALQLALASKATLVSSVCGLVSGLIVYCTSLQRLSLPRWIGKVFSSTLGRIINSKASKDSGLMGATLEIQRVQQAEAMEQQLLRARNRYNVPMNGGGRQLRIDEMFQAAGMGQGMAGMGQGMAGMGQGMAGFGQGAARAAGPAPPIVLSPAHLQTLTDMGFSRDRAEQALRQARNNLDDATNILLQDIM